MPRTPIDYSKTIIYKLVHREDYDNANIYIGSTTDFRRRKSAHKTSCNSKNSKEYNSKKYQYIRNNGGWEEWAMIEIERYPCNDGNGARSCEEYWRSHFNSQLNAIRAHITDKQDKEIRKKYREQNKDTHKLYYEKNKDKNKEKITCECGCIISRGSIADHKRTPKHRLLNKEIKYEYKID